MKYSVKQIDGEWCVVDKDTDDIVADATDRKDAVLQASALNRAILQAISLCNPV